MNRITVFTVVIAVTLIVTTLLLFRFSKSNEVLPKYSLVLANLPQDYCPNLAWIEISKQDDSNKDEVVEGVLIDENLVVTNCRNVNLANYQNYLESGSFRVVLKLPKALAFKVPMLFTAMDVIKYGLPLGDVTADNAIDSYDLDAVKDKLFQPADKYPEIDVDGDGLISVLDYSYSLINRGVGAARLDGKAWPEIVR